MKLIKISLVAVIAVVMAMTSVAEVGANGTEHCPNHNGHPGKVEGSNNSLVLPAGTVFCVKGATDATGKLTSDGVTSLFDYLETGHDVSYYVVYSSNEPTPIPTDVPETTPTDVPETTPTPTQTEKVCEVRIIGYMFKGVGPDGEIGWMASFQTWRDAGVAPPEGTDPDSYIPPNVGSWENCWGFTPVSLPFGYALTIDCNDSPNTTVRRCEGGGCAKIYGDE